MKTKNSPAHVVTGQRGVLMDELLSLLRDALLISFLEVPESYRRGAPNAELGRALRNF